MHDLTIQTKFTFGDRVRFNSKVQFRQGSGTIYAITIDRYNGMDYMIEVDGEDCDLQPGILENEIVLESES